MRAVLLLASLVLVGCSQEYLDRKNAERDRKTCEGMGIFYGDSRYPDCMMRVAQMRMQKEQTDSAVGLGMLGIGTGVIESNRNYPPPPSAPVTCVRQGVFTTCQ